MGLPMYGPCSRYDGPAILVWHLLQIRNIHMYARTEETSDISCIPCERHAVMFVSIHLQPLRCGSDPTPDPSQR